MTGNVKFSRPAQLLLALLLGVLLAALHLAVVWLMAEPPGMPAVLIGYLAGGVLLALARPGGGLAIGLGVCLTLAVLSRATATGPLWGLGVFYGIAAGLAALCGATIATIAQRPKREAT